MSQFIVTVNKLNKRKRIPATFPDTSGITGQVFKNTTFNGVEVPANLIPNPALGKWYQDTDNYYYWGGGVSLFESPIKGPALLQPPDEVPDDMPLSFKSTIKCTKWMMQHFRNAILNAVKDTPFDECLVYAIACQETAQRWGIWVDDYDAETVLKRAVFDASGDFPDTSRSAFPRNRQAMIDVYGIDFTQMLINEANLMRAMPQPGNPNGYSPANYLYKGYGIFQYDLQHVKTNRSFFENKGWYSIDECIKYLLLELNEKWKLSGNNYHKTVQTYNGRGSRAEAYVKRVSQFYTWIRGMI